VTIPKGIGVSAKSGVVVRRAALSQAKSSKCAERERRLSFVRERSTIRMSVTEAVVVVDMALRAGLASLADLNALRVAGAGSAGVVNLRRVVGFAEPATESSMESRLRMVLVLGGLPRPQAKVSLHDRQDEFVGRPDLYCERPLPGAVPSSHWTPPPAGNFACFS
jgi:hypothetical protein